MRLVFVILISFIHVELMKTMNISHNYDKCHKYLPSKGTYLRIPPYWYDQDCRYNNYFATNDISRCLSNRTIYFIGISTMRQYLFSLRYLLDGHMDDREKQKQLCSKGNGVSAITSSSSESCIHKHKSTKLKFFYFHYLDGFNYTSRGGFKHLLFDDLNNSSTLSKRIFHNPNEVKALAGENPLYALDECSNARNPHNDVRLCLQHFLNGSTSSGIIMITCANIYIYIHVYIVLI